MAVLRIRSSDGSQQLSAVKERQPGESPSPDDWLRALRSGPPQVTSSALLSGSKRGDLEGRRQACSRSALSGHFEITEGEQMEKQPHMNIHEKKINYPPYVPPALSTELSPHLGGGQGALHATRSLHLEGFCRSPRVRRRT